MKIKQRESEAKQLFRPVSGSSERTGSVWFFRFCFRSRQWGVVRGAFWLLPIVSKSPEISVGSQIERSAFGSIRPKFAVPFWQTGKVHCPNSLHLCRGFGKAIKNGTSHSSWLARFDRKISFHFPRVISPISDQSVWDHRIIKRRRKIWKRIYSFRLLFLRAMTPISTSFLGHLWFWMAQVSNGCCLTKRFGSSPSFSIYSRRAKSETWS